jgi:hypothetical protein
MRRRRWPDFGEEVGSWLESVALRARDELDFELYDVYVIIPALANFRLNEL